MHTSLNQLEKAYAALQKAEMIWLRCAGGSDADLTDIARSGLIQNFEVAYEQSWKLLKRWMVQELSISESELTIRRHLYRLAAKNGLIADVDAWWTFNEARNKSSHTYQESVAIEVCGAAQAFLPACQALINALKLQMDDGRG